MPGVLTVWVIYWNPTDQPNKYVVRGQHVSGGGRIEIDAEPTYVGTHLGRARLAIPPGLVCLGRQADDDPSILEAWV